MTTHDDALPALPIGEAEVLWHEPDPVMPERPGKIIDASHAFMDAAPLGTRLYSAEQMRAYVRADRADRAEPVAKVRVHRTGGNAGIAWSAVAVTDGESLPLMPDGAKLYAAPPALPQDAHGYAQRLATSLWERHYKTDAPDWEPLPDLMGVLTQIDNMLTGLQRAAPK